MKDIRNNVTHLSVQTTIRCGSVYLFYQFIQQFLTLVYLMLLKQSVFHSSIPSLYFAFFFGDIDSGVSSFQNSHSVWASCLSLFLKQFFQIFIVVLGFCLIIFFDFFMFLIFHFLVDGLCIRDLRTRFKCDLFQFLFILNRMIVHFISILLTKIGSCLFRFLIINKSVLKF